VGNQAIKLMIVDDNARFRALVSTILTHEDDQVMELDDGEAVTEHYAAFQPDWVLMDTHMKNVDGLEATRQLMKSFPEAKIIFLSNFTNKRLMEKGLGLGAKAYLSKEDIFAVQNFIKPQVAVTGENHEKFNHC